MSKRKKKFETKSLPYPPFLNGYQNTKKNLCLIVVIDIILWLLKMKSLQNITDNHSKHFAL